MLSGDKEDKYIYIKHIYNPNYDSRDENDGRTRDEKCTGGINIT